APDIEARTHRPGRIVAQPLDLALAGLVREGLSRHRDVAVDLDGRIVAIEARRLLEEVDRPIAFPAEGVDARVHDQTGGPPGLRIEHAEALARAAEEAHLVGQALRVKAPALDIRAAHLARALASERR